MAATIASFGDKRVVSPSWQQLLGLHMSWEETTASLPKCRTGKKQRQKERKQNGRLEKKQQQTTKPNGWLPASAGICYSLKHLGNDFPKAEHQGAGSESQGARSQACSSPPCSGTGLGCVSGKPMAPFRKGHPAARADVHGPAGCCVTLPF